MVPGVGRLDAREEVRSEMSDNKPKTEALEDLEPKQDPKGGIIAILIGLFKPASPVQTPAEIKGFDPQPDPPRLP